MPRGRNKVWFESSPGGIRGDLNPATIPKGEWLSGSNWLVRNGVGRPRPGYAQLGSTLTSADAVTGLFIPSSRAFYDNEQFLVAHTRTKAYYFDGSTYTDITGTWASSYLPVRMIHYVSSGTAYVLRANLNNAIDTYEPGTTTAFANVAAAPSCKDLCAIGPYVLTAQGYGVKWNAANDIATWPSSNEIIFQEISGHLDGVVAVRAINSLTAAVFGTNGLWLCSLQAAKTAFRSVYFGEVTGPSHTGHVCQYGGIIYWIGSDFSLWSFDGSSVRQLINHNADALRMLQSASYTLQPNATGSCMIVPLSEPEAWFFFQNPSIGTEKFAVCYNLKTMAATHHVLEDGISACTVGSLGSSEDERRALIGSTTGKVFVMAASTVNDAGTAIPWNFEYGYVPICDNVDESGEIDAVASYWKKTSSSCTVTVSLTPSDSISDDETAYTDTFDTSTATSNHSKTFRGKQGKWAKLKFSGTQVVADLEYRGALLTSWQRSMT